MEYKIYPKQETRDIGHVKGGLLECLLTEVLQLNALEGRVKEETGGLPVHSRHYPIMKTSAKMRLSVT
ncbi:hypothetical protein UPYG_G00326360 [Umbra pygmaea]|uniref:Uncharacterized protein n=1 Tax=Umbra pygmaea TaxID=75934 RepID=A0ABD0W309_UMBPY